MPSSLYFLYEKGSATEKIRSAVEIGGNSSCSMSVFSLSLTIESPKAVSVLYNSEFATDAGRLVTQQMWLIRYLKN